MAVQANFRNQAYGRSNPLQNLATPPIISQRAPTVSDKATLGTIWINKTAGSYYVLVSVAGGSSSWQAQTAGSGSFPTVEVTGGAGTVLTVDAGGDTDLGGALTVAGVSTLNGNVVVNGDLSVAGDFDISSSSAFSWVTTSTIDLEGDAGVTISTVDNTLALESGTGAINIGADAAAHTVTIGNVTGATAVNVNTGTGGFAVATTGSGDIVLNSDDTVLIDADGVLELNSSAGVISIGNDADANNINIGTGAAARVITVGNVTGATQVVLNSGSAGVAITGTNGAVSIVSGTGAINISADAAATTVNLATGAGAKALTLGSTNTTSATTLQAGSGALTINGGGDVLIDAVGALDINSSGSAIRIGNDAVAQAIAIGTGAADRDITIGNTTASTTITLNTPSSTYVVANQGFQLTNSSGAALITGAGAPGGVVTAPLGSLFIRTDPGAAAERLYINTDGGTTWASFTASA